MPRAGLSPAAVLAEAAVLVDEVGADRLTLAQLAARLGVKLPSLYKHIDSLDGLRAAVAGQATTELATAITRNAVGRSGAAALRAMADAYRGYARAHPGRYAISLRAPDPDDPVRTAASDAIMALLGAVLAGYHLTGTDALDAARAVRAALHGFVSLEIGGGFGLPRAVDQSYARLVDGLDVMLTGWPQG